MRIIQDQKDGSAEICFSWKEIWVLIRKRKLKLSPENLRHLGNILVKIVSEWNMNFNKDIKNKETLVDDMENIR